MAEKNDLIRDALNKPQLGDRVEDIQITKEALDKAHLYAKKIKEVHGSDLECYFFLISPAGANDRIVRDIYFPDQEVTHSAVRIREDMIIETGRRLRETGFKILGWSHSHASYHTFHSETDDENHVIVLNEIASDNYIELKNEKNMFNSPETSIEDGKIVVADRNKSISMVLDISGKFKGKITKSTLHGPIKVGFAYSLVVNADDNLKPHCEVAIKEYCPLYLREKEVETYKVPIKIMPGGDYKVKADLPGILEEIKNKVKSRSMWGWDDYKKPLPVDLTAPEKEVYTRDDVDRLLELQREEIEKSYSRLRKWIKKVWKNSTIAELLYGNNINRERQYEIEEYVKKIANDPDKDDKKTPSKIRKTP